MRMILWIMLFSGITAWVLLGLQPTYTTPLYSFFTTNACAVGWCANFTCYNSNQCGRNCVCAFEGNEQVGTCMRFE